MLAAMRITNLPRRGFLTGTLGLALVGVTACGAATTSGSTTSASATPSASGGASTPAADGVPTLASLIAEVPSTFTQATFSDAASGHSLPYNLYLPEGYSSSKSYPLVLYIADSSLVGQAVTAPLSQYGALIWASAAEQAKHQSIVLVPEYPSVIIDDHGSHTTTAYVEMTTRLLSAVTKQYSVDATRVYGTGQSMGCMTVMYLAAKHPELFAAELFVSGQWEVSQLANLAKEKFFFIAAGGDAKASAGQADVKKMLTADGVKYQSATWDATWSAADTAAAAQKLLAPGDTINFATFATGTVLEVSGATSSPGGTAAGGSPSGGAPSGGAPSGGAPSGAPSGMPSGAPGGAGMGGSSEHMASFEPAYKITALRDWLFQQKA